MTDMDDRPSPLPDQPSLLADERTTLAEFLGYYRAVFARKAEGLTDEQARTPACPPSDLTVMGLVRHMADVERGWFRRGVIDDAAPPIYYSDDDPEGDIRVGPSDTLADALSTWRGEVAAAEHNLSQVGLDDVDQTGGTHSVRWIVVHMIEEYARHCGHLDLLREALDGTVGD